MGVENFSFIDQLVPTQPFGSDDVSEGDDHLRGIKETLQNAFPSNDAPGSFPNMDFTMRDLLVTGKTTLDGFIEAAHQVAIALSTIDGATGSIIGPNFGVDAVAHPAPGVYEVLLFETDWTNLNDLQAGINCNMGIALGIANFIDPIDNVGPGWVRIVTSAYTDPPSSAELVDCVELSFVFFDAGRDIL